VQVRHENVKNPGKAAPNTADASTVRLRLGYETGTFSGFSAMVEAESVTALGARALTARRPEPPQMVMQSF